MQTTRPYPPPRPAAAATRTSPRQSKPLVYACSGCSSAAQMANQIALWLDRAEVAEMSCIAGVGGGVAGLVRTAQSGRQIIGLDGCVLHCVRACLRQAGVEADLHLTLSDYGVGKRKHQDFDPVQAHGVYENQVLPRIDALKHGQGETRAAHSAPTAAVAADR